MSIPISSEYNNLINNDDFIFNLSYFTESQIKCSLTAMRMVY
jgi:hypothetical protein